MICFGLASSQWSNWARRQSAWTLCCFHVLWLSNNYQISPFVTLFYFVYIKLYELRSYIWLCYRSNPPFVAVQLDLYLEHAVCCIGNVLHAIQKAKSGRETSARATPIFSRVRGLGNPLYFHMHADLGETTRVFTMLYGSDRNTILITLHLCWRT